MKHIMTAMSGQFVPGGVLDGKYILRSTIGGGRFGTVYRALHIALQKPVAVKVLHGVRPGPTVFVSAAIHGDEIVGTAIIQEVLRRVTPAEMAGTLLLVPAVNIFGFVDHTRNLPDRRDLNRSFPGSPTGSMAGTLRPAGAKQIWPCPAMLSSTRDETSNSFS